MFKLNKNDEIQNAKESIIINMVDYCGKKNPETTEKVFSKYKEAEKSYRETIEMIEKLDDKNFSILLGSFEPVNINDKKIVVNFFLDLGHVYGDVFLEELRRIDCVSFFLKDLTDTKLTIAIPKEIEDSFRAAEKSLSLKKLSFTVYNK